ncbi:hypothetical protein [Xanthovirga aplysinae]|uniref:hypothetical protein n=1 Tax=Xanthovirga aplysinae TaxID=2529853 RepID=UPI0012BD6889|nr:hypothetical protein [Xanthovirga aplysinae]MTI32802.1 hypothetical protein [Xanthovirga aplysinae]
MLQTCRGNSVFISIFLCIQLLNMSVNVDDCLLPNKMENEIESVIEMFTYYCFDLPIQDFSDEGVESKIALKTPLIFDISSIIIIQPVKELLLHWEIPLNVGVPQSFVLFIDHPPNFI